MTDAMRIEFLKALAARRGIPIAGITAGTAAWVAELDGGGEIVGYAAGHADGFIPLRRAILKEAAFRRRDKEFTGIASERFR